MFKRILVTGGAGFMGSHFIDRLLLEEEIELVVNLDLLTYAGRKENVLGAAKDSRYSFVRGDICDQGLLEELYEEHLFDAVVHFAAESHVDRSIKEPSAFVITNVVGTTALLEFAREHKLRFHHVSTDEVFGSLGDIGSFREDSPYTPNSPYSASKAASDHFVRAYHRTYGVETTISHATNNYGPRQDLEKLMPTIIAKCFEGLEVPLYGHGEHVRDWLHVRDHAEAIYRILQKGKAGEVYNVGASNEWHNDQLVEKIATLIGVKTQIANVKDRPGHDYRYAIDATKLRRELGWEPQIEFSEGLAETIQWYKSRIETPQKNQVVCIVPARLGSKRFPKKILARIAGKPLLQWVWEAANCCPQFDQVIFAIDDYRTAEAIEEFGGEWVMTSKECKSGTDRLCEVMQKGDIDADIWVNWQCDEPFIHQEMIDDLLQNTKKGDIWTLKKRLTSPALSEDSDITKVVTSRDGKALYFSRAKVPHFRDDEPEHYKHVGIYAFSTRALKKIGQLPPSELEEAEKLEQLRFLEGGLEIYAYETIFDSQDINTEEDLNRMISMIHSIDKQP